MNPKVFKCHEPDPVGMILGTRFHRFTAHCGIDGLAKENGESIELLAVHATEPGAGQFRAFIESLKRHYKTICVWHIGNPILESALERYGFQDEVMIDEFGETLTGKRWDEKNKDLTD